MKKLAFLFLLMLFATQVKAQSSDIQSSIKDISSDLASINQEIVNAYYQTEPKQEPPLSNSGGIQINIPVETFQNPAAIQKYQVQTQAKSPVIKPISKKQVEDIYEMIINKMRDFKKKYENNPYVKISGFDINIGIIPSVTVSIEFK